MIAVDLQPFSVVEDPGFCRLMKELEPRYSLPSRRYFSDVIISSIHVDVNHLVTQLRSSTNFVSLTTDIWSSDNSHHSFMSLVAHFIIDSTMEKKDLMLSCWKFDESHTAENISSNILSHIQSWDIEETLVCVVRDNAANMITGMRVANIPSLSCLAHSLQLIGIFQQPSVQQLLISAGSIIGYYHRSNTAFHTSQQIQEQLGLPKHLLIQDVSTRWNSSFYMLQRLIEQKRAITVTSTECQPPSELRTQQWTLAEKVVKTLVVFEEATREVSGNYASASVIIPIIITLKRALTMEEDDEGITRMKRGMLKSLQDRYEDVEQNSLCALATVLDPRFKLRVFSSAGNAAHARMLLTTECEEVLSNSVSSRSSPNHQPQCKRQKSENTTSSTLWNIFNEMMDEPEESSLDGDVSVGYTAEIMVFERTYTNPLC